VLAARGSILCNGHRSCSGSTHLVNQTSTVSFAMQSRLDIYSFQALIDQRCCYQIGRAARGAAKACAIELLVHSMIVRPASQSWRQRTNFHHSHVSRSRRVSCPDGRARDARFVVSSFAWSQLVSEPQQARQTNTQDSNLSLRTEKEPTLISQHNAVPTVSIKLLLHTRPMCTSRAPAIFVAKANFTRFSALLKKPTRTADATQASGS
jgi:hypothetical protein